MRGSSGAVVGTAPSPGNRCRSPSTICRARSRWAKVTDTAATELRVQVLEDFAQPALSPQRWNALLARSATDVVFLTQQWQRLWWEARGDEQLLIVLAERDGEQLALAPMFAVEGSLSLIGSGGSDSPAFAGRRAQAGARAAPGASP